MKIPAFPDPEKLRSLKLRVRIFYALFAGALMNLGLPPVNLWPFMLYGLGLFYIFLSTVKTTRSALLYGWLFGFGYFGAGLWWIANALLVEGNPFSWVWPLAIAGLPALLACFTAAGCAFFIRFARPLSLSGFFIFIVSLATAEWLRGHTFTGFPWNLYGYGWSGWLAMSQSVALGGSYFLTLMTVFWGALPAYLSAGQARRKIKIILLISGLLTFGANALYGYIRLANTEVTYHADVAVRPVQPNILQQDKWDSSKTIQNYNNLVELSAPQGGVQPLVTLVIWPETAMPDGALRHPEARRVLRETLARYKNDVYLLTGWLRYEKDEDGDKYYNSLAVIDRDLNIRATYDKAHLVPFGESIPLQDILPLAPFVRLDSFAQGAGLRTLSIDSLPPFSTLICYEVIFPGAVKSGTNLKPAWLLNITNDAWYGNSPGPYQHFAQTRFRAIEEGLPVVRAANTGISGVVSPVGETITRSGLFERTAMDVRLPQPLARSTLYALYGDLVFWSSIGLIALAGIYCRNKSI